MSKITSVEPQKKNPKRFNIFVDGEFAFGADEDLIVNHRLIIGKQLSREDLEKLVFEAEVGKVMEKMYNLFSFRQRSEREVREYLRLKNFQAKVKDREEIRQIAIDLVIERLKQKGMINDREFAKAWVESRKRSKQKSNRILKTELFQKGIDKEIIEEVLRVNDTALGQASEEDLAKIVLEKKMKSWKNLNPLEFRKKAYELLLRKGFQSFVIRKVLEGF